MSRSRRPGRSRSLPLPFAVPVAAATAMVLAVAPVAAAQSTAQPDGTVSVSSLGATNDAGSLSGSLGSLAQPAYPDYVALGDSYAAFGDDREPTGVPAACGRNLGNYPHVLDANPAVGRLTDATCGGAQIPDLTGSQVLGTPPNTVTVPPQFDALETGTDLVTLSIGGNDAGFGTIVACITRQGPFETLPGTATCDAAIGETISADITRIFEEDGPLDEAYAQIAESSPNATVITTRYLPLMPPAGVSCDFTDRLNPADVVWAREVAESLNDAVDVAAKRNGHISVLPVDATVDRSACGEAGERWTDFFGTVPGAAPFHPTALGQQAMAAAIAAAL